ncbi:MAG: transporter substrate-binding domain-containing protein [Verrucomicrobiia bacterium]
MSCLVAVLACSDCLAADFLSPGERTWLLDRRVLRVAMTPEWPPFSLKSATGKWAGIDAEVLQELALILGCEIERIELESWPSIEKALEKREVDMVMGTAASTERGAFAVFTQPYSAFPVAVIMRQEAPFLIIPSALRDKKAAMPTRYITTYHVEKKITPRDILYTQTSAEAFEAVARGDADFVVENLAAASWLIRDKGLTNLKIVGLLGERFDMRIAVRSDWPQLASILDKSILRIPPETTAQILERWIPIEVDHVSIHWPYIWTFALVFMSVFAPVALFLLLRGRLLAKELSLRRAIEEDLRAAKANLEKLNEEKDSFLAMAAHDLNSPLTQITMAAGVLKNRFRNDEERIMKLLNSIESGALRMGRLIRNLLSLHAIEQGLQPTAEGGHVCDLVKVIDEVTARHSSTAEIKSIHLATRIPESEVLTSTHPDVADQIIDNLLSNALKYSAIGTDVVIEVKNTSRGATVSVQDSGPGVPQNRILDLFAKFVTLDAKPTGGEQATGLGLAIVKRLCDATGCTVECVNTDSGAKFTVAFPPADLARREAFASRRTMPALVSAP